MAYAQAQEWLKSNFSRRAFLRGLFVISILYGLLGGWVWLNTNTVREAQENKLASQTVKIEWIDQGEEHHQKPPEHIAVYVPPETLESGLIKAPVEGLHKQGDYGPVPMIRDSDGLTPFQAYRRPFDRYGINNPVISLAITDIGLSDAASESAVRSMPSEISLILSPYSTLREFWVTEARARGHEIWMTLPMESVHYPFDDPGPHTMLIDVPAHENALKMEWLLSRAQGYIGFVGSYDPLFMDALENMRPVIDTIYRSGLGFVNTGKNPGNPAETMALGRKAPYGTVDVWIDRPGLSRDEIKKALETLEKTAQEQGAATGVFSTLPVSYQEVLTWIETLPDKGFVLAPLSAQVTY